MLRRWLVRFSFILALLLLCSGWIVSYFGCWSGSLYFAEREWGFGTATGLAAWCEHPNGYATIHGSCFFKPGVTAASWTSVDLRFGFHAGELKGFPGSFALVTPYWFLALLHSIATALVWRKTKPRDTLGGFPVERLGDCPFPPATL